MTASAVVFAYHNVGVRCLSVLLAHGVQVPLIITHRDNPDETIWFDSVAKLAELHDIRVLTPDDPNTPNILNIINESQPDYFFSFYYRLILKS
ncbi:MAG: formyltransferase, partial [Burkholderiales bacterium]